jgi:hypothetical protein
MINKNTGFRAHFHEASIINRERKRQYSMLTLGKSNSTSSVLIFWEKLLYPVAWYFDMRAEPFNQQGIGIITNDFVSLHNLPSVDTKPTYRNILSFRIIAKLFPVMFKLRWAVRRHLAKRDFVTVYSKLCEAIDYISDIEKNNQVHIAMLKHILESAAFATKNAIYYTKSGNPQVAALAALFINSQMLGTILSPFVDRSATKIHRLGVGMVVNDVPGIPYK